MPLLHAKGLKDVNRSDRHGGAGLNSDRFSLKRAFRVLGDTHDARAIDVVSKPAEKSRKSGYFFLPRHPCRSVFVVRVSTLFPKLVG